MHLRSSIGSASARPPAPVIVPDTAQAATPTSFNAPTWSFQNVFAFGAFDGGMVDGDAIFVVGEEEGECQAEALSGGAGGGA